MRNGDDPRGVNPPPGSSRPDEERRPYSDRTRRPAPAAVRRAALFLDYENLRLGLERRYHGEVDAAALAARLHDLARGEGRVICARAYGDWSVHGGAARDLHRQYIDPVLVMASESGEEGATVRMVMDVVDSLLRRGRAPDVYVIASGAREIQPLLRRLRESGKEVVLAGLREAVGRDLVRRADRVVWLDDSLAAREEPEGEIDFEKYDWQPFVRLLDSLEANLEFVGLNYLIRRVLDRTNCGYTELRRRQDIINFAQNSAIIEVYQVGNKDEGGDPVSACRLLRDHPVVARALEALRAAREREGGNP